MKLIIFYMRNLTYRLTLYLFLSDTGFSYIRASWEYYFIFFSGLECVGYSFVYVARFVFLRDVWTRTQRDAVASRRATNLTIHLPSKGILYCAYPTPDIS
jgi:hypothetical protein